MSYQFLAYVAADGSLALCEGGVYSDAPPLDSEYAGNNLAAGERERDRLNDNAETLAAEGRYALRDSADGVEIDSTVASSLDTWQLDALADQPIDLVSLGNVRQALRKLADRPAGSSAWPRLTVADFPPVAAGCFAAWRAVLASGELTDAYAESFGLLAAHGTNIRRAYRSDGATVRTLPYKTLAHIAEIEESAARSAAKLAAIGQAASNASKGADGKTLAESPIGHARYIGESLAFLADAASASGVDLARTVSAIACHAGALAHVAKSGQASHATIAASLARADSKLADIHAAATLDSIMARNLADSRYSEARRIGEHLAAFHRTREAEHLAVAVDAIGRLESVASQRDLEARNAEARAETLAASLDSRVAELTEARERGDTWRDRHAVAVADRDSLAAVNATNATARAAADRSRERWHSAALAAESDANKLSLDLAAMRERAERLESESERRNLAAGTAEAERDALAADLAAMRERAEAAERRAESLAASLANQGATLERRGQSLADCRARAEKLSADNLRYMAERDAIGERAERAERQLAEYRTLCAALPLGMAGAYPAALPLLRCYLADRESDS